MSGQAENPKRQSAARSAGPLTGERLKLEAYKASRNLEDSLEALEKMLQQPLTEPAKRHLRWARDAATKLNLLIDLLSRSPSD